MTSKIVPVILCGGSGTRLWPASRDDKPKQFLNLVDDKSLLQNTILRALAVSSAKPADVVTVTLGTYAGEIARQMATVAPGAEKHILCEPQARNTAAAVAYAAAYVAETFGPGAVMWVLPSDHHIGDERALAESFGHALTAALDGKLVTFGITPTRPETGYGYIRVGAGTGAARKVDAFVEKPDAQTARGYLEAGTYLWNSGMFLFTATTVLEEYAIHAPAVLDGVKDAIKKGAAAQAADAATYGAVEQTPFDVAIMEKSALVSVVPSDPAWSDIGAWESLWEIRGKDTQGNATEGAVLLEDTHNCLVQSGGKLVACAGVSDLVIIEEGDVILVGKRSDSDALRALVKKYKQQQAERQQDERGTGT